MDEDTTFISTTDDLNGVPGIGPARRAALVAAGFASRAALAQASAEQLVSLTGMPRAQAEKALAFLQQTSDASATLPPSDEDAPPAAADLGTPALPDDDQDPDTAAKGLLDRAAFRAKTAISDATRLWDMPKLSKPLARLLLLLDTVTEQVSGALHPKAAKRLTVRLEDHAAWIEKALTAEKPLREKRRDRIRQRLKSDRLQIAEAIRATLRRSADRKAPAKGASRERSGQSKRIKVK